MKNSFNKERNRESTIEKENRLNKESLERWSNGTGKTPVVSRQRQWKGSPLPGVKSRWRQCWENHRFPETNIWSTDQKHKKKFWVLSSSLPWKILEREWRKERDSILIVLAQIWCLSGKQFYCFFLCHPILLFSRQNLFSSNNLMKIYCNRFRGTLKYVCALSEERHWLL